MISVAVAWDSSQTLTPAQVALSDQYKSELTLATMSGLAENYVKLLAGTWSGYTLIMIYKSRISMFMVCVCVCVCDSISHESTSDGQCISRRYGTDVPHSARSFQCMPQSLVYLPWDVKQS